MFTDSSSRASAKISPVTDGAYGAENTTSIFLQTKPFKHSANQMINLRKKKGSLYEFFPANELLG